jgi:hypothetical protein
VLAVHLSWPKGLGGFHNRLDASKVHHGITHDLLAWIPFCGNLMNRRDALAVIADLKQISQTCNEQHGVRLGAVFIDTLGAAFGIDDENDAAKVNKLIGILKYIGTETGALVVQGGNNGPSRL